MNAVAKIGLDGQPTSYETLRDPDGEGKREPITVEVRYDSVERLFKQGIIEKHQFDAARLLQVQAEAAEIRSRPSSNGIGIARAAYVLSDAQSRHMARYADARKSVTVALGRAGSRGETLLRLVVIENRQLHTAAGIMGIPERSISECLRFALDALARHYGYA